VLEAPALILFLSSDCCEAESRVKFAAMKNLWTLSPRPELVVSDRPDSIVDPSDSSRVGVPGPFGRERVVFALPLENGPVQLVAPAVVRDDQAGYLADPSGTLIGMPGVRVQRMVSARWVEDTRRLSG
jgi:hypothetical protein